MHCYRNYLVRLLVLVLLAGSSLSQAIEAPTSAATEKAPVVTTPDSANPSASKPKAPDVSKLTWEPPGDVMLYGVPVIVFFGTLFTILAVRKSLPANWSLADALAEDVPMPVRKETTTKGQNGAGDIVVDEPLYDKDGKPVLAPEMHASSSRLIALMGMIVILLMFVGFGVFALYGFGRNGAMPDGIGGVVQYLVAGMTLFAPYVVNKFSALFQGLTGSK